MNNTDDVHHERDMPRNQYSLVDTCFEEGQYEAGIAVLNDLRDPKCKPLPRQIRQLLYIALNPPPQAVTDMKRINPDLGSPTKAALARQQRSENYPSQAACEAARCLLMSLVETNSPEALGYALPCYSPECADDDPADEDSYIARASLCLQESKNCWFILKEGATQAKPVPSAAPRSRRSRRNADDELVSHSDLEDDIPPLIVSNSAWPVLEWLVALFERDEMLSEQRGLPRHSPLLLSQIPDARNGSGGRWESNAPLDVVIFCVQRSNDRERTLGFKLFNLLINLTSTTHFNAHMFVASVYGRFSSISSQEIFDLLECISLSPTGQNYKIALCRKYLSENLVLSDSENSAAKPHISARPQPKPHSAVRRRTPPRGKPIANSMSSKYAIPSSAEVIRLVMGKIAHSSRPIFEVCRVKFEFLIAYNATQSHLPDGEQESSWRSYFGLENLPRTLEVAFTGTEGQVYVEALKGIIPHW